MAERPTGTVTFLFTDVEGSTRLWEEHPAEMAVALERHDEILRSAIDDAGGYVFSTAGDAFAAAFAFGTDAIAAAVAAQRALGAENWPGEAILQVRMGVCAGEAQERGGDFFGPAVNRAARLMAVAEGGQVLVSDALRQIVHARLGVGVELEELGEFALKDLSTSERVWQLQADGLAPELRPPRIPGGSKGNLRHAATGFVGRGDELSRLASSLADAQIVTLTGVGGVGKTRLAVEAGQRVGDEFGGGVWLCELGGVDDSDAVAHAVLTTLGARQSLGSTTVDAVTDWLTGRRVLLILDNCEHVIDAAADLVSAIRTGCPTVTVLATSREGLGVAGEQVWPVSSLDPAGEGVELFCERAAAGDASFAPSGGDLETIAAICGRLDGIPLAIELAAARARSLTPTDLAERLDDRFRLLRGSRRGGIERHQTIRATVEWSYRLLEAEEQVLFDRLAVFAGSFDLDAAENVCCGGGVDCDDVVDLLAALVDKSMAVVDRSGLRARYRVLETLRQYGEERLDQTGDLGNRRDAHAHHFLAAAFEADERFSGDDWDGGGAVFEGEWDNLRAAFGWAVTSGESDLAARIVEATSWYGVLKLRDEHHDWANQALALAQDQDRSVPTAVAGVSGWWYGNKNDTRAARTLAEAGLDSASSPQDRSTNWCWHAACIAHRYADDHDSYRDTLAAWSHANQDPDDQFHRILMAGYQAWWGAPGSAGDALRLAEGLVAASPNSALRVWTSWVKGLVAMSHGDPDASIEAFHECLELAEAAGHHIMENTAVIFMGRAMLDAGGSIRVAEERLILEHVHQYGLSVGSTLINLAERLLTSDRLEPAAVLLGYSQRNFNDSAFLGIQASLDKISQHTDPTEWVAHGQTLDPETVFDYAFAAINEIENSPST